MLAVSRRLIIRRRPRESMCLIILILHRLSVINGIPRERVSIGVTEAGAMLHSEIEILELQRPAHETLVDEVLSGQPLEGLMVSDDCEMVIGEMMIELLDTPDDGETLQLSSGVVPLGSGEASTLEGDGVFSICMDLREDSGEALKRCIGLKNEGLGEVCGT